MTTATRENVVTVSMNYGADNDDGSFELLWTFKFGNRKFVAALDNVKKALLTEDPAQLAVINFINGKPQQPTFFTKRIKEV